MDAVEDVGEDGETAGDNEAARAGVESGELEVRFVAADDDCLGLGAREVGLARVGRDGGDDGTVERAIAVLLDVFAIRSEGVGEGREVLLALGLEVGVGRVFQIQHPTVHHEVPGLQIAFRRDPTFLPRRGRRGPENQYGKTDGVSHDHPHSLDLATSAAASRSTARATSSGARPRAWAAANTSSYSGFTRTPSGCSTTLTRTTTSGASRTAT